MEDDLRAQLRALPRMDDLLALPWAAPFLEALGRKAVKATFDEALQEVRRCARDGALRVGDSPADLVVSRARELLTRRAEPSLRPVINATGVVVHTNLGRAPLPPEALRAVEAVARGYSTLEYSLEEGARGHRNAHVEWLLCQAAGAEAAIVANNNAGAVLLALTALAKRKEVVVSRGELVEIGGAFRIPDILAFSGARMVEVGCTNCTHLRDYEDAITEDTAVLLKVHPSNFRVEGYTKEVSREALAGLAHERGLVCMEDLGSGLLEEIGCRDLDAEPSVQDCLAAGVDVVTFSGDKMLGGPQIGCVAGAEPLIALMRKNQLLRALRVDKMTLAAFEAVLRMYLSARSADIPVAGMLRIEADKLRERAEALLRSLQELLRGLPAVPFQLELVRTEDAVGGGAFPATPLDGWGVALRSAAGVRAEKLSSLFRGFPLPVIAGMREDRIVLHVRTLLPGDEAHLLSGFQAMLEKGAG